VPHACRTRPLSERVLLGNAWRRPRLPLVTVGPSTLQRKARRGRAGPSTGCQTQAHHRSLAIAGLTRPPSPSFIEGRDTTSSRKGKPRTRCHRRIFGQQRKRWALESRRLGDIGRQRSGAPRWTIAPSLARRYAPRNRLRSALHSNAYLRRFAAPIGFTARGWLARRRCTLNESRFLESCRFWGIRPALQIGPPNA
jgi:hypothetical protein